MKKTCVINDSHFEVNDSNRIFKDEFIRVDNNFIVLSKLLQICINSKPFECA